MVDKKFSDFNPKSTLEENDIIPSETLGVSNNRTTYGDLKRQIQDDILSQYGRTTVGRFVDAICEHSGGVPLGYEDNLIYADGSQWNRAISTEIASFIDYCKVRPTLKALYQIPDSSDYFVVPDLRNKHRVAIGDVNTPYATITSKVLNPQTTVATTIAGIGDHSHPINDIKGRFVIRGRNDGGPSESIKIGTDGGFESYYEGNDLSLESNGTARRSIGVRFSSHRAGVTATNNAGNHTHTATNTVGYADPNIFDNVVRVPAFAVFTFLDISINDIFINPTAEISNIVGLQSALDGKVEQAEYDLYVTSNNTAVANKVNTSTYTSYVTSNDLAVASKVNTSTYTAYVTANDLSVASKLPISTFNPVFRSSWNSVKRTGLTVTINNSATVGRNIITDLQNAATVNSGGVDYLGDPSSTTGYPTVTNSTSVGNYRLPIITGLTAYRVGITIKVTGTFATTQDQKDLFAEIRLANGTTSITTNNLRRSIPNTGNPLVGQFEPIRVTSITDTLTTLAGGFQVLLYNNNATASTFTMTAIELVFNY
jgi:hypothetical protein